MPPEFQQFECELYKNKPVGKRFRLEGHTLYSIANFGADLNEADRAAREVNAKRAWILNPILHFPKSLPKGWQLHTIQNRMIDLSKPEKELWSDVRHGHQSEITKARRHNLKVTRSQDFSYFLRMARKNYKGYSLVFSPVYDKWLSKLPNQEMWCVTDGRTPLAMAIIRMQGDKTRYQSGATDYSIVNDIINWNVSFTSCS